MIFHIYTDGGARGNPGPAAIGVIVKEVDEKTATEILRNKFGKKIGVSTNNVAEYSAVLEAMVYLAEQIEKLNLVVTKIIFFLDSQLVASQLVGSFKVKEPTLKDLFMQIKKNEAFLPCPVYYEYIPREKNFLADREVNLALDRS